MAKRANIKKEEYLDRYSDEIEKILGRQINAESFESYSGELKAIRESFKDDSEKSRFVADIVNWWKGNSENSKSKRLSKNFDNTGKITIVSPSKILNEFLSQRSESDRINFNELLSGDEFLRQSIYQTISAWQTEYIANSQVKKYNIPAGDEAREYVKNAKEEIYDALDIGKINEYLENEESRINMEENEEVNKNGGGIPKISDERLEELMTLAKKLVDDGTISLNNVEKMFEEIDQLKSLTPDEKENFEIIATSTALNKAINEPEKEEETKEDDEVLNNNDALKDLSDVEKNSFKAAVENWENEKTSDDKQKEESDDKEKEEPDDKEKKEPDDKGVDDGITDASKTTSGGDVTNGISNEWKDKYNSIDEKLNSIEDNIRQIVEKYASKNGIQFNITDNLENDVLDVYSKLKEKEPKFATYFSREINAELKNVNKIKEEVAKEYIKITEEGIKLLRKTAEEIELVKDEISAEKRELERLNKELDEKENELAELDAKDNLTPEDLVRRKELAGEISDLSQKRKLVEKSIEGNSEKLENLEKDFNKAKEEYLEAADRVKSSLEEKGILIGDKAKEIKEEKKEEKSEPESPKASTNSNVQTSQTESKKEENLPTKNDEVIERNVNYNQVISIMGKNPIGSGLDKDGYNKVMNSFEQMIASPNGLTSAQKRSIKDIFTTGRKEILKEMKDAFSDKNIVDGIEKIIGKENMDVLRDDLSGNGSMLKVKGLGFDEMGKECVPNIQDALTKCYDALADENLSDEDRNIITNNILKPIKFACADQCSAITTRSKIQQLFRMGRKSLDSKTSKIAPFISKKDEELANVIKQRELANTPNNEEKTKEVVKEMSAPESGNKSFRDMLGDLINSKEEVDVKSKLGYEIKPTQIDFNKNKSQSTR